MILPKDVLEKIPQKIRNNINNNERTELFLNEDNILSELLNLKENKGLLKYQGSVFFDKEGSFSSFNIDVFEDFLKFITDHCVLVISKEIYKRDSFEESLVIKDFYLAYKYISKGEDSIVILIYEKFDKHDSDNDQYLFKYNDTAESNPKSYLEEVKRSSSNIIRNEIELQELRLKTNTLSVRMIIKLKKWLMKLPGYYYWTKVVYFPLSIIVKILRAIYTLSREVRKKIINFKRAKRILSISKFLDKNENLVVVYAGVQYVNNEGQRSVRLTQEFLQKGQNVLYVFWDFSKKDWNLYGEVENGLFVIPRSEFLEYFAELKSSLLRKNSRLLIHVPDLEIAKLLPEFNAIGYCSIYDILDDWEEFFRTGQCFWFDADVEKFVLRNTYKRFAVSNALILKHPSFEIDLLPNGFSSSRLQDRKKLNLELGKKNLGYFGHLTDAWFDWDLILEVAKKEPKTYIHIIGYGIPENLVLPVNIKFYGKIPPEELSGYVKNWDACIIPFKDIKLSKSVNPIKVYEYLYFKKPVIVTGIPGMEDFPYVYFSKNKVDDFISAVNIALSQKINDGKINKFLKHNRWEDRAKIILKS